MPLYMDIHTVDNDDFSVEDVVKAHMEDLAIQERFGVTQIKYWVNVDAKTLFCLMRGPNIESCNQVHVESHGNTACNIIEVKDDEFNLFLGEGTSVNDLAHTISGDIDTGYRTILQISIRDTLSKINDFRADINRIIKEHKGALVLNPDDDIMVSFVIASDAIACSKEIEKLFQLKAPTIEYNFSIVSGRPVDEVGIELFEETKKKVEYLSLVGINQSIYIDEQTIKLAEKENTLDNEYFVTLTNVNSTEFKFLFNLFEVLNLNLFNEGFASDELQKKMGFSKSNLYRKIKSLTKISPNQLIQELRMRNALKILKRNNNTIAETAFDLGFNSPTYFAKVFRQRFNITPTDFLKIS